MRQVLATLRHAPSRLVGVLIALVAAAVLASTVACLVGTALTMTPAPQRLAAAGAVVVGDQQARFTGEDGPTSVPLNAYSGVPASLATKIARLPGVRAAVPDVSIPLALRASGPDDRSTRTWTVTAHGWPSAALTPLRVVSGQAPTGAGDIAVAAGSGLRPGEHVRLIGRDGPPLTVTGLLAAPAGNASADGSAYLSAAAAARLSGHPGRADLIAVLTHGPPSPGLVAQLHSVAGTGATVYTGHRIGLAERADALSDRSNLSGFAIAAGIPLVVVSLFVVAGAVSLSISGRRRELALVRAVGATPGQLRRARAGELAVLGLVGGAAAYPIGVPLARTVLTGMIRHGLAPAGAHAWSGWPALVISAGVGLLVAVLAGFVASWRVSRAAPADALRDAAVDRARPHPVRLLLGLLALGGAITLTVVSFRLAHDPTEQLNLALVTLLAGVAAVGLLGPAVVSLIEAIIRRPAQLLGGPSARLATADIRRRPRRIASAVAAVSISVGFLGAVYLVNADQVHAGNTQAGQRLAADEVLSAPAGISPDAVSAAAALPGVSDALGVASTTAYVNADDDPEQIGAAAVTAGAISPVLRLGVVDGSLEHLRDGQVAISQLAAGSTKVGSTIRIVLSDGTPYRARVIAIYSTGLGFGDAVVPLDAAGGGHVGPAGVGQILLRGHPAPSALRALADRYGLTSSDRDAATTQAEQLDEQGSYLNTLIVIAMALLALVTLLNTLVTATVERRDGLRLLQRLGATSRQLLSMAGWQAGLVCLLGLAGGAASASAGLLAATRALTGHWTPYLPAGVLAGLAAVTVALSAAAVLVPTAVMLRRGER